MGEVSAEHGAVIRRVRNLGADNKWWILLALILIAVSAATALRRWHPFAHGPPAPVGLLPGLTVEDAPPPQGGLIVTSLQSGSESARSGIMVGDDIRSLDGRRVDDLDDAIAYLRKDRAPAIVLDVAHGEAARQVTLRRQGERYHGP
jgi:S1-C subfamily serine protease